MENKHPARISAVLYDAITIPTRHASGAIRDGASAGHGFLVIQSMWSRSRLVVARKPLRMNWMGVCFMFYVAGTCCPP